MEPSGSTPYRPQGADGDNEELAEVIVHEDELPPLPSNVPVWVMAVAIGVLIATLGVIAFLVNRAGEQPQQATTADPTGMPVLPVTVGDQAREPGEKPPTTDFGIDRSVQTTSATFKKNGQNAYLVIAARPISDVTDLLKNQIKAEAIRQVGDGVCGRDRTDLDVCAVRRNQTVVLVAGLRQQEPTEQVNFARDVLAETK